MAGLQRPSRQERSRPPVARPHAHTATAPWQVASWDITYLRSFVRGQFFYLYLVEDVWSRKILGWAVHEVESLELAAALVEQIRRDAGDIDLTGWVLHSDNGGPMKGATMLATLQHLGVVPSFSRPSVSDDNPFSEALFRTLKYCPQYSSAGFASVDAARAWVARFVDWYNHEHQHSGIGYVTPAARHAGDDVAILAARSAVYERARRRHPERWAGDTRQWERPIIVTLNPENRRSAEPITAKKLATTTLIPTAFGSITPARSPYVSVTVHHPRTPPPDIDARGHCSDSATHGPVPDRRPARPR